MITALPGVEGRAAGRRARFPRWSRRYVWGLVVADALAGILAGSAGIMISAGIPDTAAELLAMAAAGVAWSPAILLVHGYDRNRVGVGSDEIRSVLAATVAVLATIGFVATVIHPAWLRGLLLAVFVATILSLGARLTIRKVLHRRRSSGRGVRSVVVVGAVGPALALVSRFERERHFGMRAVSVVVPTRAELAAARASGLPAFSTFGNVPAIVHRFGADAVAVTSGTEPGFLRSLGWALERRQVELLVDPGLMEVAGPRLHIRSFEGLPLLYVEEPRFSGWTRFFKTVTDKVAALLLILLGLPVMLAVAVAIRLDDGGPVFFRQTRIGKDGRPFTMWKFRSMACGAELAQSILRDESDGAGPLFKLKADPRVTRVGAVLRRYSLDELPQLINVLAGTMSLVGPRPPLPSEVEKYRQPAHRRLLVAPGLTGLWQINGRSDLSWEESVRLDLRYVENWTFAGDLLILWKTVFAVLGKRGAY